MSTRFSNRNFKPQPGLFPSPRNPRDVVQTPAPVARAVVDYFKPTGRCLDPCRGDGVFHGLLPIGSDYCEIAEGRDFFAYSDRVDWVVGNPPYSIFYQWLLHSFEIAENVVYLIPVAKSFTSLRTLKAIWRFGGVREVLVLGTGRQWGFELGFALGATHYQRGYRGGTVFTDAGAVQRG